MHGHVKGFVQRVRPKTVRRVYEVGSRNTNGSLRAIFADAEQYHGIDVRGGHGVDAVADGESYVPPYEPDCVVCTEVLEHAPNAKDIVRQMAIVLAPAGMLIVTCAGPGRKPHSWRDGQAMQPGEHYRGIAASELADWMRECGLDVVVEEQGGGVRSGRLAPPDRTDADVRVVAVKRVAA